MPAPPGWTRAPLRSLSPVFGGPVGSDGGRLGLVHTTIEAEVDDQGNIRPKEPLVLAPGSRVLVTVSSPQWPRPPC